MGYYFAIECMYHRVQLTRVRALEVHGICTPGGAFEGVISVQDCMHAACEPNNVDIMYEMVIDNHPPKNKQFRDKP